MVTVQCRGRLNVSRISDYTPATVKFSRDKPAASSLAASLLPFRKMQRNSMAIPPSHSDILHLCNTIRPISAFDNCGAIHKGELTLASKIDTSAGVYTYRQPFTAGFSHDSCFPAQSGKLHVAAEEMKGVTLRPLTRYPMRDVTIPRNSRPVRSLAVNPLRSGPVRINLYNYYGAHREGLYVWYRVAAPLEGSPIGRKLVYIFLLCRLEGRPIASPLKHLAITAGTLYTCVRHHMRPAPPRLASRTHFRGPRIPTRVPGTPPKKRKGEKSREGKGAGTTLLAPKLASD